MKIKSISYKILGSKFSRTVVRRLAINIVTRGGLNSLYGLITSRQRLIFSQYFADIFKNYPALRPKSGEWQAHFAGKCIRLPLRSTSFDLDWSQALNIVGREPDVVKTLRHLIGIPSPPQLFLDIGANYGLYSLLFLIHGVETISFEPNAACFEYFRTICALNNVVPRVENVALSNSVGVAELLVPDNNTVLGSLEPDIWAQWKNQGYKMLAQEVEVRTLDTYMPIFGNRRLLIKIDAEGHEYHILEGATKILEVLRPTVIFETYSRDNRADIFTFLTSKQYIIQKLPYNAAQESYSFEMNAFLDSTDADFIALPRYKE